MELEDIPAGPKFVTRVDWKRKDIIRHTKTFKPFKVLHVFIDIGTLVVDLTSPQDPAVPFIILPRDYPNYCKDSDLKCKRNGGELEWSMEVL